MWRSSYLTPRPACRSTLPRLYTAIAVSAASVMLHTLACGVGSVQAATVVGSLRQWHAVEVAFDGPLHGESDDAPNPFTDYRLQCAFTAPGGKIYDVPGFFDADGAGGEVGSIWKCRLAPDRIGLWQVRASFRSGSGVAVSLDPSAGTATGVDGETASFVIAASGAASPDFRAASNGSLVTGEHYLRFAGSGRPWLKGGSNIPENFLGYVGFEGTPAAGHAYASHVADWHAGDPDWNGGAGRR
ncbi:MAG: DUF5060 domain-containing protein, partial [Myxococcales bacterium]